MSYLNLENKKILVVEDDEMSFLYLNQLFIPTKCKLFHARTGSEAMQMFRNNRFELILMDIQLPDTDGTSLTREIRLMNHKIPIIAQTAGKTCEERVRALESGCSEVIVKPFSMEELFEAVKKYIGNQ